MANISCGACEDLRQEAPGLIVNGFDETMCASLKNDTGLSPSSGNNDCTDLNNLNDCLVGNMATEVESYDVCDWKSFMKQFIPNVWTTLKGIVCAVCGLWTNIHNLWSQVSALCKLISMVIAPSAPIYGIFPRDQDAHGDVMGFIPTINGRPALIDVHSTSHNADNYTGVGLRWGEVESIDCEMGVLRKRYFWKPYIWGYAINKNARVGDALWAVSKSQLQSRTSWSDRLWQSYTDESWTWTQHRITSGADAHKNIWLKLHVGDGGYSDDYLVLTFAGTSYPNDYFDYDATIHEGDVNEVRWG